MPAIIPASRKGVKNITGETKWWIRSQYRQGLLSVIDLAHNFKCSRSAIYRVEVNYRVFFDPKISFYF